MTVSIRFQILGVTVTTLLAAISAYLVLATRVFSQDKLAYIYDVESSLTATAAEELRAHVEALVDKLAYFAAESDRSPGGASAALLGSDPDLLSVEVWRRRDGRFVLVHRRAHASRLAALGLSEQDLADALRRTPPPLGALPAEGPVVQNASVPGAALLSISAPIPSGDVVVASLRPDRLLRIFGAARAYRAYVVDGRGTILLDSDPRRVTGRESALAVPLVREAVRGSLSRAVHLFPGPDGNTIGAFTRVGIGRMAVIAEVPEQEALRAARQLVRRSLLVGVAVLLLAVIATIAMARPVTAPLRRLEAATEAIARGEFGRRVEVRARNEIGRLAEAFNRMGRELEDRDRRLAEAHSQLVQSVKLSTIGEISASLAHEVKNPLSGIVGYAQLAREQPPSEAPEFFRLIEKNAWRASEILVGLLRFARDERVEREAVDAATIVEDSLRLVRHELAQRRIDLTVTAAPRLPTLWANANQLQQVVVNLVVNAAHAMEGRPQRRLAIDLSAEAGSVRFTISDTGVGMTPEVRQKIFTPFFTTKASGAGTGLGLSVSQRIVKQHGGAIEVESSPDQGTTFTFRIPSESRAARIEGADPPAAAGA